ncbi:hypothetical protein KBC75_02805 [Candidatus Shapirobacteria bacterium]|nr:hypothetical protein [Candidatus Shapirobacteria bacterium]
MLEDIRRYGKVSILEILSCSNDGDKEGYPRTKGDQYVMTGTNCYSVN